MWQIINEYIGILIMMLGVILFGKIILNKKSPHNKLYIIITLLVVSSIQTLICQFLTSTLKTLVVTVINILLYKNIYKISLPKSILLTFFCTVILLMPEGLLILIMTNVFGMSKEYYYAYYAGSILGNLSICILFLLLTYIIINPLKRLFITRIEDNRKIIISLFLTLICVAIVFYQAFSNIEISLELLISIFVMFGFISILLSLIKQTIENNELVNKYDKLLEFMKSYEIEIENQRILRHEVKNEFRTIRAKICDNQENKEIIEYIDEIVNDKYEIKKEKYAKFGYLPPNGIKGLCYFKVQEAENRGIVVNLNISKRIKNSTIYNLNIKQQRDFGRILGVFLDNAIEASLNSQEKKIGIEAYANSKKEFKLIISNTYSNKIDKNKIGLERFSTKGEKRGHGLLLVKQLTGKNSSFEVNTTTKSTVYIQSLKIKKT